MPQKALKNWDPGDRPPTLHPPLFVSFFSFALFDYLVEGSEQRGVGEGDSNLNFQPKIC